MINFGSIVYLKRDFYLLLGGEITGFSLVKSESKFLTSVSCLGERG